MGNIPRCRCWVYWRLIAVDVYGLNCLLLVVAHYWSFLLFCSQEEIKTAIQPALPCRYRRMRKYLQLCHTIRSAAAKTIYERASLALLREQIYDTLEQLATTSRKLCDMHMHSGSLMHSNLWEKIDTTTTKSALKEHTTTTNRQICKYDRLENKTLRKKPPTLNKQKIVVIRSKIALPKTAISVFAKSNNFAITPRTIPKEKIIANMKDSYEKWHKWKWRKYDRKCEEYYGKLRYPNAISLKKNAQLCENYEPIRTL